MEKIKGKILKELLIHDAIAHYFLWPLIILSILLFLGVRLILRLQFGKMLLNKISSEFFPAIAQYDIDFHKNNFTKNK